MIVALALAGLVGLADAASVRARANEMRNRLGLRAEAVPAGFPARKAWVVARWPTVELRLRDLAEAIFGSTAHWDREGPRQEGQWFVVLLPWLGREIARSQVSVLEAWWEAIRLHEGIDQMRDQMPEGQSFEALQEAGRQWVKVHRDTLYDPVPRWEQTTITPKAPPLPVTVEEDGSLYVVRSVPEPPAFMIEVVQPRMMTAGPHGRSRSEGAREVLVYEGPQALVGFTFDNPARPAVWSAFEAWLQRQHRGRLKEQAMLLRRMADAIVFRAAQHAVLDGYIRESLAGIFDWVDQAQPPVDLLRYDWVEAAQAAAVWHASLVTAEVGSPVALEKGDVVRMRWPDGWTLVELHSKQSLVNEGVSMAHCVGGYWPQVRDGGTSIWSLRDAQSVPQATLEIAFIFDVCALVVQQAKARGNDLVAHAPVLVRVRATEAVLRLLDAKTALLNAEGRMELGAPEFPAIDPVRFQVLATEAERLRTDLEGSAKEVVASRARSARRRQALRQVRSTLYELGKIFALCVPRDGFAAEPYFMAGSNHLYEEDQVEAWGEPLDVARVEIFEHHRDGARGGYFAWVDVVLTNRQKAGQEGRSAGDLVVRPLRRGSVDAVVLGTGKVLEEILAWMEVWPSQEVWFEYYAEDGADGVVVAPL